MLLIQLRSDALLRHKATGLPVPGLTLVASIGQGSLNSGGHEGVRVRAWPDLNA